MPESEYSKKLKDPRWQRKRLQILERDEWKCTHCFRGNETLHVHHSEYLPGAEPWDHPDNTLRTLCQTCHGLAHAARFEVVDFLGEKLEAVGFDNFPLHALAFAFGGGNHAIPPLEIAHVIGYVLSNSEEQVRLHALWKAWKAAGVRGQTSRCE